MAVIFTASADPGSSARSSRIIEPLVRWLFPGISDDAVGVWVLVARKCAHVTEYAIMAMLVWMALRGPTRVLPRPWTWREPRITMLVVLLYAASDEIHQTLVPSRQGVLADVGYDTLGGVLGLALLWAAGRWRKRW